jgi:hypothetical protein
LRVEYHGDRSGRKWQWTIRTPDGEWTDYDLCEPMCRVAGAESGAYPMLRALRSLVSAGLERAEWNARHELTQGDDLFPAACIASVDAWAGGAL